MRVRITNANNPRALAAGTELDVEDTTADRWVRRGVARIIGPDADTPKAPRGTAELTAESVATLAESGAPLQPVSQPKTRGRDRA